MAEVKGQEGRHKMTYDPYCGTTHTRWDGCPPPKPLSREGRESIERQRRVYDEPAWVRRMHEQGLPVRVETTPSVAL